MKKSIWPKLILGAALAALSSCHLLKEEESVKPRKHSFELAEIFFKADTAYYSSPSGLYDRTLYFNSKGEPTESVPLNQATGNARQFFVYNNKGALIQWIAFFGDTPSALHADLQVNNIFNAHTYTYDALGNIAVDSFFLSATSAFSTTPFQVTTYTYDYKGRIITTRLKEAFTPEKTKKEYYYYNIEGNLDNISSYDSSAYGVEQSYNLIFTYDNKPNVLKSSKVLSFLNRNYSTNNTTSVTVYGNTYHQNETYINTYNAQGLLSSKNQALSPVEGYTVGTSFVKYRWK